MISVADDPVTTHKLIPLYVAGIASLFAAAILWFFPLTIAKRIYPIKQASASHQTLSSNDLYSLGFIILGAYLLFYVVSDAIYWIVLVVIGAREIPGYTLMNIENKSAMITTGFEFIISLLLIFRTKGIIYFITKNRR